MPLESLHRNQDILANALFRSRLKDRAVNRAAPVRWRLTRIVVSRKRNPREWRIRSNWRHAMKADLARFENHTPIECGLECLSAVLNILVPKLYVPAPSLVPNRIEIKKEIEAT